MFCANCGTKNADDARFCESCGTGINAGASAASQPATPAQAAPPPPVYQAPAPPPPPAYQPPVPPYAPPPAAAGAASRLPLIIGAIAAVAVLGAAGWYFFLRDSGESIKFDPTKGDALAHSSLIQAGDLPGAWTLTAVDAFDDDTTFTADSCSGVKARIATVRNALTATRAGRASTELTRTTKDPNSSDTTLSMTVDVQKDTKTIANNLSGYQAGIQGTDVPKCLEDSFKDLGADTVKVTKVNPSTAAPKGGVATAYEIAISISGQNLTLRVEDFAWSLSNAAVSLSLNGPKADITAEIVTTALAKGQAALERTASGTVVPGPVAPATATAPPKSPTTAARTPTPGSRTPTTTTRGTPTVSPALVTWANGFCKALEGINLATDPADQDYSKLPLDQAKASFQFDGKGFSDALGKAISQERTLQPPFQAAQVQEGHLLALAKAKTTYDAALTQVAQARTIAEFNTAITNLKKGRDDVIQSISTIISSAPADVQQALDNC